MLSSATSPALAGSIYGGPTQSGLATYSPAFISMDGNQRAIDGVGIGTAMKNLDGAQKGYNAWRWDPNGNLIRLQPINENLPDNVHGNGASNAFPSAVNASGVVVGGTYLEPNTSRPAVWDTAGNITLLPSQFGTGQDQVYGSANDINDAGYIVGAAVKFSSGGNSVGEHAAYWDLSHNLHELTTTLGTDSTGNGSSYATTISQTGIVVGSGDQYGSGHYQGVRALRWNSISSTAAILPDLPDSGTDVTGESFVSATAVNNSGVTIGASSMYVSGNYNGQRAIRWNVAGQAQWLQTPGFTPNNNYFASAADINNSGVVVGYVEDYNAVHDVQENQAYRWNATSGTPEVLQSYDLGDGVTNSRAYAVNDAGVAVGYSELYANGDIATAWLADGTLIDLNDLLNPIDQNYWRLTEADTITEGDFNTSVWITGTAMYYPDGISSGETPYQRDFLLNTAVPEPTTLSLLGLSGIALLQRRKRR
jgi:hypothetical protein